MVNSWFNGVCPAVSVNALAEEPLAIDHSRGRGRERVKGRGRARVESVGNEVPIEYIHINEIPPVHIVDKEEDIEVKDVKKNGQEKEVLIETMIVSPIDTVFD